MGAARGLLQSWLERQLEADRMMWLEGRLAALRQGAAEKDLYITLGLIPRRLGKADLLLGPADVEAALRAHPGFDPAGLSIDQAARILVLLTLPEDGFAGRFRQLCRTADLAEAIAFYRGLPLYPGPGALEAQAAEGTRSNMRAVFEAVAHRNPYPRAQFSEHRWNHMVLKALFIGSTLYPIQGLDERANPDLATMLCDYAHERWAAGRPVSPELWRCVGPFAAGDEMLGDLKRVITTGGALEREAAALALASSPDPGARGILEAQPDLVRLIDEGVARWDHIGAPC